MWLVVSPHAPRWCCPFGGLDATSGTFHVTDHERKLATHRPKVVDRWLVGLPRISVLWMPRDGANEVIPAERIWGLLKTRVAANRVAGSIEAFTQKAHRFVIALEPHPVADSVPNPTA